MAFYNQNNNQYNEAAMQQSSPISVPRVEINSVIRMTYMWLGLGLLVTMVTAYVVGNTESLLEFAISPAGSIIGLVGMFGSLLVMSFAFNRLSANMLAGLYFVFTAIMGFSLSVIMVAYLSPTVTIDGQTFVNEFYDPTPVYAAAASTAALFAAMTFIGFTTKMDLTKMGTYLMMGLFGIIIASLVNIFLQSDGLSFIISIAGVIIFTGLTAWDTQKIKEMSMNPEVQADGNLAFKLSVMGAVTLYLDILNLFLFLLSLFGRE